MQASGTSGRANLDSQWRACARCRAYRCRVGSRPSLTTVELSESEGVVLDATCDLRDTFLVEASLVEPGPSAEGSFAQA